MDATFDYALIAFDLAFFYGLYWYFCGRREVAVKVRGRSWGSYQSKTTHSSQGSAIQQSIVPPTPSSAALAKQRKKSIFTQGIRVKKLTAPIFSSKDAHVQIHERESNGWVLTKTEKHRLKRLGWVDLS